MDEIDKHVFDAARLLECSFLSDEITQVSELSTENAFEFIVRSLWLIDPDCKESFPSELPLNIATRLRLCTQVAKYLKDLHISESFGFQTLLYGNTYELRQLFVRIIEKLPRHIYEGENAGGLGFRPEEPLWVPEFCRRLKLRYVGRFWCPGENDDEFLSMLWSSAQSGEDSSWVADLINANVEKSIKPIPAKRTKPKPPLPPKPSLKDPALEAKRKELSEIQARVNAARSEIIKCYSTRSALEKKLTGMKPNESRKRLLELLKDVPNSRIMLHNEIEAGQKRLKDQEAKFHAQYAEKMRQLEELRRANELSVKLSSLRQLIERRNAERDRIMQEIAAKEKAVEKLENRLSKIEDESIDRNAITTRIFEMLATLKKQKDEIKKVVADTELVQKDLKWLSQTLYRTFSIIEEALYKNAQTYKGEEAYRLFGRTNVKCNETMETMEKNGLLKRQILQLEDQIEIEQQKQYEHHLQRVQADLITVEEENSRLKAELDRRRRK